MAGKSKEARMTGCRNCGRVTGHTKKCRYRKSPIFRFGNCIECGKRTRLPSLCFYCLPKSKRSILTAKKNADAFSNRTETTADKIGKVLPGMLMNLSNICKLTGLTRRQAREELNNNRYEKIGERYTIKK